MGKNPLRGRAKKIAGKTADIGRRGRSAISSVKKAVKDKAEDLCCGRSATSPRRKVTTAGFVAFSWYVRVTGALLLLLVSPLVLLYLLSLPLAHASQYAWAKVVSRRRWKEGERVRTGKLHRLVGPAARQVFVYMHTFLSNVIFFALVFRAVTAIVAPTTMPMKAAFLYALVPAAVLLLCSVVFHYFSSIYRLKNSLPLRYSAKLLWRSPEKTYDRCDDSVFNLTFRDQIRSAMSMTSLARMDQQLLLGVPTALVAAGCYLFDLCTGQEKEADELREEASTYFTGISVDWKVNAGLFKA